MRAAMLGAGVLSAVALSLPSCSRAPGAAPPAAVSTRAATLVVATAPAGASAPPGSPVAGTRVRVVDATGAVVVDLSRDFAAAGTPALSADAQHVAFVGRPSADASARLVVMNVDGSARRVVDTAGETPLFPAFLPDGGVVYLVAAALAPGAAPRSEIHVARDDGSAPQRITFGGEPFAPAVVADGRVVYFDRDASMVLAVHVDGTGVAPYAEFPAGATPLTAPAVAADGSLLLLAATDAAARLLRLDPDRAGAEGVATLAAPSTVRAAAAGGEGRVVLACGADGVVELPSADAPRPRTLFAAPRGEIVLSALPVAAQPRPSLHLSIVDRSKATAELFGIDLRRSQIAAVRGAAPDGLARVVFRKEGEEAPIGSAPVASDGSYYVTVPVDAPLSIEIQDAEGRAVARERHAFWLRPGERRGCVGCHEERLTAPPNRRPLALLHDADPIGATAVVAAPRPTEARQ